MAKKRLNLAQSAHDRLAQSKRSHPALIEFLSAPAQAVAPEMELDLRRDQPDGAAGESKFLTAKELLALISKRGAVLTEADARAIEELKKL
jgi:hypothetical protein